MIILSDLGASRVLNAYFNNIFPANKDLTLKLYTNNYSPTDASTAASFTEATGGGYVSKTLVNGNWTVAYTTPVFADYTGLSSFIFTGAIGGSGHIYGYYIVNSDNVLIWAEKFTDDFTPSANGDILAMTARIGLGYGTPS